MDRLKVLMAEDVKEENENLKTSLKASGNLKDLAAGWTDDEEDYEEEDELEDFEEDASLPDNGIEVRGETIDDALYKAGEELGVGIEYLDYEVLKRGSKGFLGIGKSDYILYVTVSGADDYIDELDEIDEFAVASAETKIKEEPKNVDSQVKIKVLKSGVYLTITKPKGTGNLADENKVLQMIYQREIEGADFEKVKKEVKEPTGQPVKIAEYIPNPEYDGRVIIETTEDEMKAYATVVPPKYSGRWVEYDDVIQALNETGVVYGIKEEAIKDMLENEITNQQVEIAAGDKAINGADAYIDFKFKKEKTLVIKEDEKGKVDFHNVSNVENVTVGQVLAIKVPAEPARDGRTIRNEILPAKPGMDIDLPLGNNVSSPDGIKIVSDINGQVVYKRRLISVEPVYDVQGDVNLSTGNVVFLGTVRVHGSVDDGFSVTASGNIEVMGNVQKANLQADGDIIIKQGVLGKDEAVLNAGNDIIAKFVEHANLYAENDIYVSEAIMHSKVAAGKRIILTGRRAMVVGGLVRAGEEINAKKLGSESYTDTELEVGVSPKTKEEMQALEKEHEEIIAQLDTTDKNIRTLVKQKTISGGKLPEEKEEMLKKFEISKETLTEKEAEIKAQIEELKAYLNVIETKGKICASQIVYPGVKIVIKSAIMGINQEFKFVTFTQDGGNIRMSTYEEPKIDSSKILVNK